MNNRVRARFQEIRDQPNRYPLRNRANDNLLQPIQEEPNANMANAHDPAIPLNPQGDQIPPPPPGDQLPPQDQVDGNPLAIYRDLKSLFIANFTNAASEDAGLWILTLKHKIQSLQIPPERAVRVFPLLLGNTCIPWYQALPDDIKQDYEALLEAFSTKFVTGTQFSLQSNRNNWYQTSQGVGESVKAYADRIRQMGLKINVTDDETLCSKFLSGLNHQIRSKIALFPIQSFAQALDLSLAASSQIDQDNQSPPSQPQVYSLNAMTEKQPLQTILDKLDTLCTDIKANTQVQLANSTADNKPTAELQSHRPARTATRPNYTDYRQYQPRARSDYHPRPPPIHRDFGNQRYNANYTPNRPRFNSQPPARNWRQAQWRQNQGPMPNPFTQNRNQNRPVTPRVVCYKCGGANHLQRDCMAPAGNA